MNSFLSPASCAARPFDRRALPVLAFLLLFFAVVMPSHGMGPRRAHPGETETGLASWYGTEQQGCHTANGGCFDRHALTAAHRHLPFGTVVRVTNKKNGKSVEVRITDRGPFRGGRIIDVSEAAANILDMKRSGTVPVLIEVIRLGSPKCRPPSSPSHG